MTIKNIPLQARQRVLCVDDEQDVLDGVQQTLRRHFKVDVTTDPFEALKKLQRNDYAVVMSDMRMPTLSGAVFLARAAESAPDTVRMLLTGQSDLQDAVAAVNDGGIFRFLMKPCPPPQLLAAMVEAGRQHELIISERQLLEETLRGSVQVLAELLGLVSPSAFGRANRLKRRVSELAAAVALPERWQVEVAAMLGQLGLVTCAPAVIDKVYHGHELSADEAQSLREADDITRRLLLGIPRLDQVLALIDAAAKVDEREISRPAMVLRVASDFDALEVRLGSSSLALSAMSEQSEAYDPEVFSRFKGILEKAAPGETIRSVPLADLSTGMVLAEDLLTQAGAIFAARGYEITERFVARARNFPEAFSVPTVKVVVKAAEVAAAS